MVVLVCARSSIHFETPKPLYPLDDYDLLYFSDSVGELSLCLTRSIIQESFALVHGGQLHQGFDRVWKKLRHEPGVPLLELHTMPTWKCSRLWINLEAFPIYAAFARDHRGQLILTADENVILSDELVYAAMKVLTQTEHAAYQGVWNGNGKIYFHGLLSAPVWQRWYALIGLQIAARYGYRSAPKNDRWLKAQPSCFTIVMIVFGFPCAADAGRQETHGKAPPPLNLVH